MPWIVVEHAANEAQTVEELRAAHEAAGAELEAHEVRILQAYLSTDRERMICVYQAPDIEVLRRCYESGSLPGYERMYQAVPLGDGGLP